MSRRAVRLILVPAILFTLVAVGVFTLAKWHPAKSDTGAAVSAPIAEGSAAARGEGLFEDNCARCHGEGGEGGGIGPTLAGAEISLDEARTTIENGSGAMPAGLVTGQDLEDVLAYLETILAP
jgi:mono/diheme cytochrome c family protein